MTGQAAGPERPKQMRTEEPRISDVMQGSCWSMLIATRRLTSCGAALIL